MTAEAPPPPPLAVYLHWPYCARICPYCDFVVVRDRGRLDEQRALLEAMLADLRGQRALTGPRRLTSLFFGGGTPSRLPPAWAAELVVEATRLWAPAPDLEVTLEANPTAAEADRFAAFAAAGINRLSLGLQALDDADLRFLGRDHDAAQALGAAREAGRRFPRLSLDLIYALPGQTPGRWRETLARAADLGAEHLSPYQLTVEAGTAFDRAVGRGAWTPADPELAATLYDTTQEALEGLGYDAYEVSNHARGAAARSRHNLAYWTGVDHLGVGPGAHGRITTAAGRLATRAAPRLGDYRAAVAATGLGWGEQALQTAADAAEERVLSGLRLREGVAWGELEALALTPGRAEVRMLVAEGLLADDPQRLRATPRGRLVLDAVTRTLLT